MAIQDPTRALAIGSTPLSLKRVSNLNIRGALLSVKISAEGIPHAGQRAEFEEDLVPPRSGGWESTSSRTWPLTQPEKTGHAHFAPDRLWSKANMLGPLAMHRKAAVLEAIERRIAQTMCGPNWANQNGEPGVRGPTDRRTTVRLPTRGGRFPKDSPREFARPPWNLKSSGIEALKSTFAEIARTYSVSGECRAVRIGYRPRASTRELVKSKDAATAKVLAGVVSRKSPPIQAARPPALFFAK